MIEYERFLKSKLPKPKTEGIRIDEADLNPMLFDFQKRIVSWALDRGKAAVFASCGLGKTPISLEWSSKVCNHTGGNVLILAPLAVSQQTVREGKKFKTEVHLCRTQADVKPGINITNYEMLKHFEPSSFTGVVIDESSILKGYSSVYRKLLTEAFHDTPFKLACTATPAPNDHLELGNHAEFLNVCKTVAMLSRYFINDTFKTGQWRLKGHAKKIFWEWVASWAVCLSKPSDIGNFSDDQYILPPLRTHEHVVDVDTTDFANGRIFRAVNLSSTSIHDEMRRTAKERAEQTAALLDGSDDTWIVWCNTNYEADELKKAIPSAVEVRGADSVEKKETLLAAFSNGEIKILISKPSIAGFGLNWEHCHKMVFVGLSYSFEQQYQATRRCWRFGQKYPVDAHFVMASTEVGVLRAVQRKASQHEEMEQEMYEAAREVQTDLNYGKIGYEHQVFKGNNWKLIQGDAVNEIQTIKDASINFSIFSPPFSDVFVYSDSVHDMGNCGSDEEFMKHFAFLIPELLRITIPGRLCAVHCRQLLRLKQKEGVIGLKDFRGQIISMFENGGWVYHSEVCIWKDPVVEMQRTKAHGLLYNQLRKDASASRQGLPDYLLIFRKWDEGLSCSDPVTHTKDGYPLPLWQRVASPVWFDIDQTDVLNVRVARDNKDERHICPLQLGVIDRALELWTNPGDLVFSPFAGIGSEGYVAVKMERRFLGVELKPEYAAVAAQNLKDAERHKNQKSIFELDGVACE